MGLLDYISPLLTQGANVASADAEGKREGNALLRAIHQQQDIEAEKQATTQKATAEALLASTRNKMLSDPTKVLTGPDGVNVVHTATGSATPVTSQSGTPLRGTPKAPPHIDPLSPQGIAARKQLQPPAKPRNIDPLSPEGIAARQQLKPTTADKGLAAPMAAKVGQAGEMVKKAADFLPAMDALDVTLGNSAAQDIASQGIGVGHARIPGTQGLGSSLLNTSPEYAKYQSELGPFVLAAAHALSGARINDEQVKQIRASIEIKPGDAAAVRAQKKKNVVDLVNSISGSLPHDAMAAQEGQMAPGALTTMHGAGYRSPQQGTAPVGDVNLGKPTLQERVQQLKAQGVSKEAARAQLVHEGLLPQ